MIGRNGVGVLLLLVASAVCGQDGSELDRISVTGSRISYRDLLDTPAIGLTRRGDYLSQSITLINDTRSEPERRRELHDTIARLVSAAGARYRIEHGDVSPITLNRENYRVEPKDDGKRLDVSRIELRIMVDIDADVTVSGHERVRSLRKFVESAQRVGRTEIDLDADTALGMYRPERYRYELIQSIADDSNRIAAALGNHCTIELEGLNSRIEWERVGPIELLLYVPYTMTVKDCRAAAPAESPTQAG